MTDHIALRNAGTVAGFDILPGGDVLTEVFFPEDSYAHYVKIGAQELAGIAEASAAERDAAEQRRLAPIYSYLFTTEDGKRDIPATGHSIAEARSFAGTLSGVHGDRLVLLSSNEP
jgi:hypothetical protein